MRNSDQYNLKHGWAHAKRILERVFGNENSQKAVEVGWVKKIGCGLSRDTFAAHVELDPDPQGQTGAYVVLLPRRDADPETDERTQKQARILEHLSEANFSFRVPRVVGVFWEYERPTLVLSCLDGIELDLRAGRYPQIKPWEIVGEVASAVHHIEHSSMKDFLPGPPTRRAYAEEKLSVFKELNDSEINEARAWAVENMPGVQPSSLIHGDLLGQNILLCPDEAPAVIDWEYCQKGDPAYDLAIITRGTNKPFQVSGGRERLIEAYAKAGGTSVKLSDVYFYEVMLAASWYRDALSGAEHFEPLPQAREWLSRIVKRAMGN